MWEMPVRILVVAMLVCLSACSWFAPRRSQQSSPTEIVVTGAPAGSIVYVDGVQGAQAAAVNDRPQILNVAAGSHKVEIHAGEAIVYREDTYVGSGEHRVVRVLSGLSR
jgi:hypothetical protein